MDIFVAKLNSETSPEDLQTLFTQFGKVSNTKVIMDKETGMSKCYGFVEMEDESEGNSAIEHLNDSNFMGNYIVVKKSEPRPKNDDRRSFNRRSGGGGGFNRDRGGNRDGGGYNRDGGNRRFDRSRDNRGGGGGYSRDRGGYDR